jgi:hypothetical protein
MTDPVPYSMPAPSDNLWSRLAHTPLWDTLRGRLTARLDARRVIAAFDLPESVAGLVWLVVRRTRLWRSEKVDVAGELASHFRDGLDAGRDPADLVRAFGDPAAAAKLIRRAKIRNRSWRYHALRRSLQAAGLLAAALVVLYAALALRYFTSAPRISRDFVAEINAGPQALPLDQRAWPLYREALLQFTTPLAELQADFLSKHELPTPEHASWQAMLDFIAQNQQPLALVRQAGERRELGFVFGDPADREWLLRIHKRNQYDPLREAPLFQLLLPHVQDLSRLRRLLKADIARSLSETDRESLLSDIRALVGMAEQLHAAPPQLLVVELHAIAAFNQAVRTINHTLATQPDLLTEDDLRRLAHKFSSYRGGGPIRLSLAGERMMLHDVWQRIFSDDGAGDGHLTSEGLQLLVQMAQPTEKLPGVDGGPDTSWEPVFGPGISLMVAGRRETRELADRLFDKLEAESSLPMWAWGKSTAEDELKRLHGELLTKVRYMPVLLLMPAVLGAARVGEHATQERDALLAALALTLYERRHGAWPETLAELSPDLLPIVPVDRLTGQPLHYRLVDNIPRLYSVGHNHFDDGGRAADTTDPYLPPRTYPNDPTAADDWLLWEGPMQHP